MSRTYRRDNYVPLEVRFEGGCGYWHDEPRTPKSKKEFKKDLAIWRSDHHYCKMYMGTAPRWYCKMIDKPKKLKVKRELQKINRDPDYDYNFDPFKKDAGWTYW